MKKLMVTIALLGLLILTPAHALASMIMTLYVVDVEKMNTIETDGAQRHALLSETNRARVLDLEKTWNGIDFLLTRTDNDKNNPRSWVIFGRKDVGEDLGYGPARLLSPSDVKEIAMLLKEETPEKLALEYDPKLMDKQGIYPQIWVRDGQEALSWLLGYYKQLVVFYGNAAKNGQGVLIVLL